MRILTIACTVILAMAAAISSAELKVVYPKSGQTIGAVDSTFILGHISPPEAASEFILWINEHEVPFHSSGAFLAFLPISAGDFEFRLRAVPRHPQSSNAHRNLLSTIQLNHKVRVPKPLLSLRPDSLALAEEIDPPSGDMVLNSGDWLRVAFRATPGCRAWFSVEGVANLVPMAEGPARPQPYWGESVFGAGNIPDSLLIKGVYHGFVKVPEGARADSQYVQYFLAPPDPSEILTNYLLPPFDQADRDKLNLLGGSGGMTISKQSSYRVTANSPDYPVTVRFTDSVQTVRHGPRRGYLSIFQPEGVEALAVGAEGDWYRLQLSHTQEGWAHKASVEQLLRGVGPPRSYLSVIRSRREGRQLYIEFPLTGKHAYRIEEADRRTLRVRLYGVTTDTDWIRYDFSDDLVDLATWSQPEPDLYEFVLNLNEDIWGYDSYYDGTKLMLVLTKAPDDVDKLKGKVIVVDPGHAGDPGSIGATGYTEAEANLAISLVLKKELEDKGATVIMTREGGNHVPLYDRPAIAKINNADLFVSVHNNALPDGVNPFENNGSATFYYHPHSINLARAILKELLKATKLPDYGLYHGNLAVNRPTQYPAVLVECAFMIIPEQEALLKTDDFRKDIAKAITKGIREFLKGYKNANR